MEQTLFLSPTPSPPYPVPEKGDEKKMVRLNKAKEDALAFIGMQERAA